ncbi:ArnT family glycosyltransferase [Tsuneonella sp. HG222]
MASVAQSLPQGGRIGLRADWIAAFVLLLVTLLTRGFWFGDPVADFDDQLYSFVGWRMTQGDLPYVDVWDRKPFGLFAIFALAHGLFGPGPLAYQGLAALAALGGAWLVYLLARDLVDRGSATVAGSLYLMLMAAYGSYSGQSEIFHVPLMLAMLWLVRDPARPDAAHRAVLAMALGGLALQVKYTVLPQCLFLGGYALWCQWRRGAGLPRVARLAAVFALAGIAPTTLVAAFYAAQGHFDAFWFANFVSFFERTPSPHGRFQPAHIVGVAPLAMLIVPGLYAAFRLKSLASWRRYGLYCGWALAALGTVLLPATVYLYYYGALVPAAILIALPLIDRTAPGRWLPAAALLAGCLYILNFADRIPHSNAERRAVATLSATIEPLVGAKRDCLYLFDGPTVLYRTTGTCLPTKFVYPDHLNNALERKSLGTDQVAELARVLATRPAVIVTADKPMTLQRAENTAQIAAATARDYVPLMTTGLHHREVTAWVRRDLAD